LSQAKKKALRKSLLRKALFSLGDKTAIELFLAGVRGWEADYGDRWMTES
jgi:hypothetical protein